MEPDGTKKYPEELPQKRMDGYWAHAELWGEGRK
jgi:hypothetical protein